MGHYLILAFCVTGCAMQSPLVDTENERGGFVVTKPPIQVTYRGDISEIQHKHMLEVIDKVSTLPYKDYKFNENHNVRLNSIDGKTDKINIDLVETTTAKVDFIEDVNKHKALHEHP